MSSLYKNFLEEFYQVCRDCGRDPKSVRIIAVSKKQTVSKIHEVFRQGQIDFGENYVQEAIEKQTALGLPQIHWHMIGPIQTNKINKILGKFCLIHSVDSLKTAQEINSRAAKMNLVQPVLLQLNLADEETKSGQSANDLIINWKAYQELKNIAIDGLMTMPPLGNSSEYFDHLRDLALELKLEELSMGTSSDWKDAIARGSTMIRIGTAIFGERT